MKEEMEALTKEEKSSLLKGGTGLYREGPFIDKIALVYRKAGFDHKAHFHEVLLPLIKDGAIPFQQEKKKQGGYLTNSLLINGHKILWQCSAKHLRFEWNPFKLGREGHRRLGEQLYAFFNDGSTALFHDFVMKATCTRLHIAFDWGNCPMERLGSNVKNKVVKHAWTNSGKFGSIYYGPDAKHPQIVMYEKLAELKSQKEKDAADDILRAYYEHRYRFVTRMEFREQPKAHLWQLDEHPFKFNRLQLFDKTRFLAKRGDTPLSHYIWESLLLRRPKTLGQYLPKSDAKAVMEALAQANLQYNDPKAKTLMKKGNFEMWNPDKLYAGQFMYHVLDPLLSVITK